MTHARTLFISFAAVAFALGAGAGPATYKWVDKDGKVHYSDAPAPGAQKVDLKPITEIPSESPAAASDGAPGQPSGEPMDKATQYTSLTITSPSAGEVLRPNGAGLSIQVELIPPLGGGDRLEYLLDGQVVPATVSQVDRGSHTIGAQVVSPDGAVKISATPVAVQVHQTIARQPVKTPPKPPKPTPPPPPKD